MYGYSPNFFRFRIFAYSYMKCSEVHLHLIVISPSGIHVVFYPYKEVRTHSASHIDVYDTFLMFFLLKHILMFIVLHVLFDDC